MRPTLAWTATLSFVLSPLVLMMGGLPPDRWWRLFGWALLLLTAVGAILWNRRLVMILLLALFPVVVVVAMRVHYPCWSFSNAAWCGHFCDDDPCMCPARARGPAVYGAGAGCRD
jgi:hypothetical protein